MELRVQVLAEDTWRLISICLRAVVAGAVFLPLSAANAQSGGPYDLQWSTIDGGGVTFASSAPFTLGGTAGQPDAATIAGGPYDVAGGLWADDSVATSAPVCVGDCRHDGAVTIDEIITGVNIALENTTVAACPAFDANRDNTVTIDELIAGVNNALSGCH